MLDMEAAILRHEKRKQRQPKTLSELYPTRKERGPNGRGLCRYCGEEVPKGRRTWCSGEHVVLAMSETDWAMMCQRVYEDAGGVCAGCGTDIGQLEERYYQSDNDYKFRELPFSRHVCKKWLRERGYNEYMRLWQVDHIVARIEGGGEGFSNLRLLCVPCHKKDTAALAAKRAAKRKIKDFTQMEIRGME